jgi:hypothetical protein
MTDSEQREMAQRWVAWDHITSNVDFDRFWNRGQTFYWPSAVHPKFVYQGA